ncbi:MAG TPA: TPM domain-containing protein [Flavobacteriia bacterium]|jgi:uncharacterized membrane protein|nr:TPM domain-containing protein [Flavobacteriia bacterium]
MNEVEQFLTEAQEKQIIEAIRVAEKNTSGEIRVHIEKSTSKEVLERAKEVFYYLKMDATKEKNGVLFYVAVHDKKFAVLGDIGIDKKVPKDFWNSVTQTVIKEFKNENYALGLEKGILETGEKLKAYFPYQSNDINELSDEISY